MENQSDAEPTQINCTTTKTNRKVSLKSRMRMEMSTWSIVDVGSFIVFSQALLSPRKPTLLYRDITATNRTTLTAQIALRMWGSTQADTDR